MEPFGDNKGWIHSDIVSYILEFIPFKRLIELKLVCKLFNRILESSCFWENKTKRDFPGISDFYQSVSSRYIESKYLKLKLERFRRIRGQKVTELSELISKHSKVGINPIEKYNNEIENIDEKIFKLCRFIEKIESPKTRYNLSLVGESYFKILGPEDYYRVYFNINSHTYNDFKRLFKVYFNQIGLLRSFSLFLLTSDNLSYICIYVYRGASGLSISYSIIQMNKDSIDKNAIEIGGNKLPDIMYHVASRHNLTKKMLKEFYNLPFDFEMSKRKIVYDKISQY